MNEAPNKNYPNSTFASFKENFSDQVRRRLWRGQRLSVTRSGDVCDEVRDHLCQRNWGAEEFCRKSGLTPHQMAWNPSVYRASGWWGVALSPHQRPHQSPHQRPHQSRRLLRCLAFGWIWNSPAGENGNLKFPSHCSRISNSAERGRLLSCYLVILPFGEAGRDSLMVRCVVRCLANTSPSETRCGKGFAGVLVRCCRHCCYVFFTVFFRGFLWEWKKCCIFASEISE